jgi:hypothetical protein
MSSRSKVVPVERSRIIHDASLLVYRNRVGCNCVRWERRRTDGG